MNIFLLGFIPILFLIVWIIIVRGYMESNKQRKAYRVELDKMQAQTSRLYHTLQLTEFRLKEANYLNNQVKQGYQLFKETNRWVEQAIKEKVSKKKIRGKRRKKSA